jgi:hypothetical protein
MPDEGWVRIYHPDHYDSVPDPDEPEDESKYATVTVESFETMWQKRGWVNLDEAAEAVDLQDMPEDAKGRIAWIDEDPVLRVTRARTVLDDEEAREHPRTTVVEHAENVITSAEEQTSPDNEFAEE